MMKAYILFGIMAGAIGTALAVEPAQGTAPVQRLAPAQLLSQFDRDNDGKISRVEAPERMQQRWDQIDTDHDGFISREELNAREARVGSMPARSEAVQQPGAVTGLREMSSGRPQGSAHFQPAGKFSVITVGTGSPQYDATRSGPSSLIQYQGRYFLVDMGNGTQARLNEAGIPLRNLAAIMLTHHHLDHDEEFIPVLIQNLLSGSSVEIVGPPGTAKLTDFTREFYAEDMAYRMGRRGKTQSEEGRPSVREVKGGESFMLGGMKVTTVKVNHTIYTVAYRFEVDGQSIVISGDLAYSESLVQLASNADVLVIDSGSSPVRSGQGLKMGGGMGRPGGSAMAEHAHSSRQEICDMARKAGVKKLVLTHFATGTVDEDATKKVIGEGGFKGEVVVGHDLLQVRPDMITVTASAKRVSKRVFVNAVSASAAQNGGSWATAFSSLQAALASGASEIWVAKGVYKPTAGTDRAAVFQLKAGTALYGGFSGDETEITQRDWQRNLTTLSGDIGRTGDIADNSFHVVAGANDAVIDGFTITGGYAMNPGANGTTGGAPRGAGGAAPIHTTPGAVLSGANTMCGAGMVNFQCAPTIRNCTFSGNQAGKGGAMYNMVSTSFRPNSSQNTPVPVVINCRFLNNFARGRGGAVANDLGTSPTFDHCQFIGNSTDDKGGGMYNDFGCSPMLRNCLFVSNTAYQAAAMGNDGASSPLLVNCTFTKNTAIDVGAALNQGTGPANNPTLINCIVWDNRCEFGPGEIANWHDCEPVVSGSCIRGGYPGKGNIDKDPKFTADYGLAWNSPCPQAGYTAAPPADAPTTNTHRFTPLDAAGKPNLLPTVHLAPQLIVYVNGAATGTMQDGKSWATAYRNLQEGMDHAWKCGGSEVWVASGTYKPGHGGDRTKSFQLRWNVAVYGGFTGVETSRAQRDVAKHPTILDGDNAYHVLIGCDNTRVDGCTITGGNADGETYDAKGGGLINYHRAPQGRPGGSELGYSPFIVNCRFVKNHAREGGAIYSFDRGYVFISHCSFEENSAENGGAIVDRGGVKTTLSNCVFKGNTALWRGGALYLDYGARLTAAECLFEDNKTGGHGGAVFTLSRASQLENTIATFKECSFAGNQAEGRGGAIANTDSTLLTATACAFNANHAGKGGGAVSSFHRGEATLLGCSYVGNTSGTGKADVDAEQASGLLR